MRILQSHEIATISGSGSSTDDLVELFALAFMAPIMFVGGTAFSGGAVGHITGSIAGYQLANHFGASTGKAYLSGFGLGLAGLTAGGYAAVHGGVWLFNQFNNN